MRITSRIAILFVFMLISCKPKKQYKNYIEHQGYAAGTNYMVEYEGNAGNLNSEIDAQLMAIDKAVSISNPSSIISKLNSNDSNVVVNKHFTELYNLSLKIYNETNHALDPTIQPVINWWGREVKKFVYPELIDSMIIDSLRSYTGFSEFSSSGGSLVKKRSEIYLDFNHIYEGYTTDLIYTLLTHYNVANFRVETGGKIRAKGTNRFGKPWEVGLDDPTLNEKKRPLIGVVPLNGKAFATAGSYREFYTKGQMKLPYTIDPTTLKPVEHTLLYVAVFAPTAAEAQAYANAFMVMGPEKTKAFLQKHPDLDVYLISTNYKGEFIPYLSDGLSSKIELVKEVTK
jgi:FAD:protein FMN transferase